MMDVTVAPLLMAGLSFAIVVGWSHAARARALPPFPVTLLISVPPLVPFPDCRGPGGQRGAASHYHSCQHAENAPP